PIELCASRAHALGHVCLRELRPLHIALELIRKHALDGHGLRLVVEALLTQKLVEVRSDMRVGLPGCLGRHSALLSFFNRCVASSRSAPRSLALLLDEPAACAAQLEMLCAV